MQLRDLQIGDIGWLIQRHGELYAQSDGFDASFELLVADILLDFARNRDQKTERGWIAARGETRFGSIFCTRPSPDVAKLRLFFVEPSARGTGLGQQLLDTCVAHAKGTGARVLTLWTHESHAAACRLYARNGFSLTDAKPVHSFGVNLVEQQWELTLR